MPHQELCRRLGSSRSIDADRVDDRVLRRELEHHRDVTELEVGVDEHHRLLGAPLGQRPPRLAASTDLPAPPLVEKTVMTLTEAAVSARARLDRPLRAGPVAPIEPLGHPAPRRRRAAPASTGAASTSLTPGRRAVWRRSVDSSAGDEHGADLAVGLQGGWDLGEPTRPAHDGPSTITIGAPLSRALQASTDATGLRSPELRRPGGRAPPGHRRGRPPARGSSGW